MFLSACDDGASGASPQSSAQPSSVDSVQDDAQDEFTSALGGGNGGGTLIFDGTSYSIESAICHLDPPVEVGTVGEGFRIMIGGGQRPSASIVGPGSVHWTHVDWQTTNFTVAGKLITGSVHNYRNNADDRVVEASFEIECP